MSMEQKANLISFEEHLTQQYGEPGTETREKFEEEFEAFRAYVITNTTNIRKHWTGGAK